MCDVTRLYQDLGETVKFKWLVFSTFSDALGSKGRLTRRLAQGGGPNSCSVPVTSFRRACLQLPLALRFPESSTAGSPISGFVHMHTKYCTQNTYAAPALGAL